MILSGRDLQLYIEVDRMSDQRCTVWNGNKRCLMIGQHNRHEYERTYTAADLAEARRKALEEAAKRADGWLKLNSSHYSKQLSDSLQAEILSLDDAGKEGE